VSFRLYDLFFLIRIRENFNHILSFKIADLKGLISKITCLKVNALTPNDLLTATNGPLTIIFALQNSLKAKWKQKKK
jgi:hypothetical protein